MKAYAIKCEGGYYHHKHGITKWPVVNVYKTQKEALEDGLTGDEIIPIEIEEITGTKRRFVK